MTAGSGAPRKGDLRLPGAAEETDVVGRQTASGAWAGTAQKSERAPTPKRGTPFPANWHCPTNRSTTPQRLRGLPQAQGVARSIADTRCASSRQQRGRLHPGRPEHFWRGPPRQRCGGIAARYNTATPYLGVETAKASGPAPRDCWLLMAERPSTGATTRKLPTGAQRTWTTSLSKAGVPEAAGCPNQHKSSQRGTTPASVRRRCGAALCGRGPAKCGVLRRARAGDGPGAKPLPAADYARAGHTENGPTKL